MNCFPDSDSQTINPCLVASPPYTKRPINMKRAMAMPRKRNAKKRNHGFGESGI